MLFRVLQRFTDPTEASNTGVDNGTSRVAHYSTLVVFTVLEWSSQCSTFLGQVRFFSVLCKHSQAAVFMIAVCKDVRLHSRSTAQNVLDLLH